MISMTGIMQPLTFENRVEENATIAAKRLQRAVTIEEMALIFFIPIWKQMSVHLKARRKIKGLQY